MMEEGAIVLSEMVRECFMVVVTFDPVAEA